MFFCLMISNIKTYNKTLNRTRSDTMLLKHASEPQAQPTLQPHFLRDRHNTAGLIVRPSEGIKNVQALPYKRDKQQAGEGNRNPKSLVILHALPMSIGQSFRPPTWRNCLVNL